MRDGSRDSLAISTLPLRASTGGEGLRAVDHRIVARDGAFEAANPNVRVRAGGRLADGFSLPDSGVRLVPVGAVGASPSPEVVDGRLSWTDVATDTDLWLEAMPGGLRTFDVLRSERAPERLGFDVRLPAGARLEETPEGVRVFDARDKGIAVIGAPWARDAEGEPVEVSLSLEGQRIVLSVPHRGQDVQYPLLVDPPVTDFQYWFGNDDVNGPFRTWSFVDGSAGRFSALAGFRDIDQWTWARGLFVYNRGSRWFDNGQYAYYGYGSYRESFIYRMDLAGVHHRPNGTCLFRGLINQRAGAWQSAYYSGPYSATSPVWWCQYEYSVSETHCSAPGCAWDGPVGNTAAWGVQATGYSGLRGDFTGYVGAATVYLYDYNNPTVTPEAAPPAGWTRGGDFVQFRGTDPGLGMKRVIVTAPAKPAWTGAVNYDTGCTFGANNRCLDTAQAYTWLNGLDDGIQTLRVEARDIIDRSSSRDWTIKVDASPPEIALSGQLADRATSGYVTADTTLSFDIRDGAAPPPPPEDCDPGTTNRAVGAGVGEGGGDPCPEPDPGPTGPQASGVSRIDIQVDDPENTTPPEQTYTPTCAGSDNCSISDTYTFRPASFPPDGEHTVTVIAQDRLGQTSTRSVRVVSDTQLPSAADDRPAPSQWDRNRPAGVAASDSGSGVRSIVVSFGGLELGGEEAEDCGTSARCPASLEAGFDTSALPEGGSTATVTATDAAGRASSRQSLVRVDRVSPEISLAGSLTTAGEVLFGPSYDLEATVTDSDPSGGRSGVRRIEVEVDGQRKASRDGSCNADNACPQSLSLAYALNTDDVPDGYHVITVLTEDGAGNVNSQAEEVIVSKRGPLTVALGELRGLAGRALQGGRAYDVSVTGTDQLLGVKTVGLLRTTPQGDQEVARSDSGCIVTGCPPFRRSTLSIDPATLPEGEQVLRAFSANAIGQRTQSEPWRVVVDRTPPAPPSNLELDFEPDEQVAVFTPTAGADPAGDNGAPGSGSSAVEYRERDADGTWREWETVESGEAVSLYRDEDESVDFEARSVDHAGNRSVVATATRRVPTKASQLRPPQQCVPEGLNLGRASWDPSQGGFRIFSSGQDVTARYDSLITGAPNSGAYNLPDCRWAKTLNPADPSLPLPQPLKLTQDGAPIAETRYGKYAFEFQDLRAPQPNKKKKSSGAFERGPILDQANVYVPVFDSYGNPFAYLKQPDRPSLPLGGKRPTERSSASDAGHRPQ